MRPFLLMIALPLLLISCDSDPKSPSSEKPSADLNLLVDYMKGYYSSENHARRDTNIDANMVAYEPIWKNRDDGAWLYVEQARLSNAKNPYRQRIYHLVQQNDSAFSLAIFKIPGDSIYVGAHRDPTLFTNLQPEGLEPLEGCDIQLAFRGNYFSGGTEVETCKTNYKGATYRVNETDVYRDSIVSQDRGYNDSGEIVWGAENNGTHFVKMASGM